MEYQVQKEHSGNIPFKAPPGRRAECEIDRSETKIGEEQFRVTEFVVRRRAGFHECKKKSDK